MVEASVGRAHLGQLALHRQDRWACLEAWAGHRKLGWVLRLAEGSAHEEVVLALVVEAGLVVVVDKGSLWPGTTWLQLLHLQPSLLPAARPQGWHRRLPSHGPMPLPVQRKSMIWHTDVGADDEMHNRRHSVLP